MYYFWLCTYIIFTGITKAMEQKKLEHFYSFGGKAGDKKMIPSDDNSTSEIPIAADFPFFDSVHKSLYVNTNGLISFLIPVSEYTPQAFPLGDNKKFIAPFWSDVDTRRFLDGGVYYRQVHSKRMLTKISEDIIYSYPRQKRFSATWAFIATWDRVSYFGGDSEQLNSFQVVLATDERHSYAIFNYGDINWITGSASGGDATGFGGTAAQAGFNAGDGIRYFSIPGSRTNAIRNVNKTSNVGIPGRWLFRIEEAEIIIGPCDIATTKQGFSINLINETLKNHEISQNGFLVAYACNQNGVICGSDWTPMDSKVACKEMGFPLGAMKATKKIFPYELNYDFFITNLQCTGKENSLSECQFKEDNKTCKDNKIIKLTCNAKSEACGTDQWRCKKGNCIRAAFLCDGDVDCRDGSDEDPENCQAPFKVRLVGGNNDFSGRVEVRRFGTWGTICSDKWDKDDAEVVCHMLGFRNVSALPFIYSSKENMAEGLIWLDDVDCTGTEKSIEHCPARPWSFHDCSHKQDAGISCSLKSHTVSFFPIPDETNDIDFEELQSSEKNIIIAPVIEYGAFPWQAGIRQKIRVSQSRHLCSGAILSEFYVISVAHCFRSSPDKSNYIIRVGDFNHHVIEEKEEDFEVDELIPHEHYRYITVFIPSNDVILIKIKPKNGKGIHFGKYVQSIQIAEVRDMPPNENTSVVSGWDHYTGLFPQLPNVLKASYIKVLPTDSCRIKVQSYEVRMAKTVLCAECATTEKYLCPTDQGRPLTAHVNDIPVLIGLYSWGDIGEEIKIPEVYVYLSVFKRWITNTVFNNS